VDTASFAGALDGRDEMPWGLAAAKLVILTVVQHLKQEHPMSEAFDPRKSTTAFDQASVP
jgi:hypothetical protein